MTTKGTCRLQKFDIAIAYRNISFYPILVIGSHQCSAIFLHYGILYYLYSLHARKQEDPCHLAKVFPPDIYFF